MAKTVASILSAAASLCQDDGFKYWTQVEFVRWINEAQSVIVRMLPSAGARSDVVRLKPGTLQHLNFAAEDIIRTDGSVQTTPVSGISLMNIRCSMGADGFTPGAPLRPVSISMQDMADPGWRYRKGPAPREYMTDPTSPLVFHVSPGVPDQPRQVWVSIEWCALPREVPAQNYVPNDSNTTISLGDEYAVDVVNYVVARANMKEAVYADQGKASTFSGMFVGSMNNKVESLTGTNPNLKRLPFDTSIGGSK